MRPLSDQVVVITGASSGIGREAALMLAERGARGVLAARNEEALNTLADGIRVAGGACLVVPTDVTSWPQVHDLAAHAVHEFGRIDTWVNGAAVSLYSRVEDAEIDELERVTRVDLPGGDILFEASTGSGSRTGDFRPALPLSPLHPLHRAPAPAWRRAAAGRPCWHGSSRGSPAAGSIVTARREWDLQPLG
ncbi:MAG: SDR family NAD(P)-dependent oxidoreductase [Actinomycetota bacterium]|nr:SDR family NAD(P)-dependent oxidoreductase [Actinomycetota bacterium]